MSSIMNAIKENWYAFYILGLSIITAVIKWIIRRRG